MLGYASDVSGTVFPVERKSSHSEVQIDAIFPQLVKNTIAVLNDGLAIEDFGLTDADLDDLNKESSRTIREYLVNIVTCWQERSNYLEKLYRTIPKPTEIWTIFAYPDAEGIVSQFSRHSEAENEAWTAFHSKLWEYIPNSQRRADWDPKRLQLAINGSLKTRIMYLPTNVVVCAIAAYAQKIAAQLDSQSSVSLHAGRTSHLHRNEFRERPCTAYLSVSASHRASGGVSEQPREWRWRLVHLKH